MGTYALFTLHPTYFVPANHQMIFLIFLVAFTTKFTTTISEEVEKNLWSWYGTTFKLFRGFHDSQVLSYHYRITFKLQLFQRKNFSCIRTALNTKLKKTARKRQLQHPPLKLFSLGETSFYLFFPLPHFLPRTVDEIYKYKYSYINWR